MHGKYVVRRGEMGGAEEGLVKEGEKCEDRIEVKRKSEEQRGQQMEERDGVNRKKRNGKT